VISQYRLKRRVQFYETDAAGIVHFTNYFRYMEEAEHALWREAGLSIYDSRGDVGWPRIAASFEYYKPLRFEEEFEVVVKVVAITRKTMTYLCELIRGDVKVGAGRLTVACVRRQSDDSVRAVEIPPEITERFAVATGVDA
jgi:YbgC/YbaW family acyl-CoA thioester hydrolase